MKKSIINLGGNLYNVDGSMRRKAPIKPITIPELEEMIDNCPEEGVPGNQYAKRDMIVRLYDLYNKYGNPHETELIEKLKQNNPINHTTTEEINDALTEVEQTYDTSTNDDEYIEYEEAA